MSPSRIPAASAGLPGMTAEPASPAGSATRTPWSTGSPPRSASAGVIGSWTIPIQGRVSGAPAAAWRMSGRAIAIGIAKPIPSDPPSIAVFTPITRPSISTSAPPELPGLIAASVWIRPRRVRRIALPQRSSTVSSRAVAETTPLVTLFV